MADEKYGQRWPAAGNVSSNSLSAHQSSKHDGRPRTRQTANSAPDTAFASSSTAKSSLMSTSGADPCLQRESQNPSECPDAQPTDRAHDSAQHTQTDNHDAFLHLEPPHPPLPWTWLCHRCRHRTSMAIRHCLRCGHTICVSQREPNMGEQRCVMEFDYDGWRAWMVWRREEARTNTTDTDRGTAVRDCSRDCNYPSQCLHERYAAMRAAAEAQA